MVEYGTVEPSTVCQASFWDYWQLQDGYVAAVDSGKWWMGYIYNMLKIYVGFAWTTCTQLFTSISIQIVLELRLAQWREMVSQPPEKMRSTATAKPVLSQKKEISYNYLFTHQEYIRCRKQDNINLETELTDLPPPDWITCIKIFKRKLEVLFELVDHFLIFSVISSCKGVSGIKYMTWGQIFF